MTVQLVDRFGDPLYATEPYSIGWRPYPEGAAFLGEGTFSATIYTSLATLKRITYRGRFTRAEIRQQFGPAKKYRRRRGRFLRKARRRGETSPEWFG